MIDKKAQIRKLYEDAVFLHLVHEGHNPKKVSIKILWNEELS